MIVTNTLSSLLSDGSSKRANVGLEVKVNIAEERYVARFDESDTA